MEELYENLKKSGKNSVNGIIQWMKEVNIVDNVQMTEERARDLFNDVLDKENVTMEKFNVAVTTAASEQKKNLEELLGTLTRSGSRFMDALKAGTSAFKETLAKKD